MRHAIAHLPMLHAPAARCRHRRSVQRDGAAPACVRYAGPMPVLAIAQRQGGVGTTTLARHLLAALARRGVRPLGIDLDPQAALSRAFGAEPRDAHDSIHGVLTGTRGIADVAEITRSGVALCAAHPDLARLDGLGKGLPVVTRLRRALAAPEVARDGVVIDCGTRLDVLLLNALFAADLVVVPVSGLPRTLQGAVETSRALDALTRVFKRRRARRYVLLQEDASVPAALDEFAHAAELCVTVVPWVSEAEVARAGGGATADAMRAYDALLSELEAAAAPSRDNVAPAG